MRRLTFLAIAGLGLGCGPDQGGAIVRSCIGWPREAIEGAFVYSIESIEVRDGAYTPPPAPPMRSALAFVSEGWVLWQIEGSAVVVRADWFETRPSPTEHDPDRCVLTRSRLPWYARNRVRLLFLEEYGSILGDLDPTLAEVSPTFGLDDEYEIPSRDPDGLGFAFAADYAVRPEGCRETSCVSTVRVRHRFRRPPRADAP